jgi:hypothetical protein
MVSALFVSRLALGLGLASLILANAAFPRARRSLLERRKLVMALGTFALGLAIFALFFGLIAACNRL